MADENSQSNKKIKDLQSELARKDAELAKYRHQLGRANETLEKIIVDLDHELKLAAKIQKLLSPTEMPSIPGFEFSSKFVPGMKSGGDYFDIFEHEDKLKFGILVSSSSGYTMSALFLSILMKFSGQIEARRGLSPEMVLKQLGSEILSEMGEKDSVSMFYAVVDRRNFEIKYSSVGKISCLYQSYSDEKMVQLESTGGPLSKASTFQPLAHSFQLNPRDRLILCTEGATRMNQVIQSLQKLSNSSVHDLRNEIVFQVESINQSQFPDRDLTVLVTEVKDRVIKLAKKT